MMYRGVPGTGTPLIDLDEPPATGPILGYSHQAIANLYTYARNDPINRVDPSGLDSTVITIEGTSYSITDSNRVSRPKEGDVNRAIAVKEIAEDAKAVFLALSLEGALYRHGMAAAVTVVKEMRDKANEGSLFSTVDLDYVTKYGSRSLTKQEIAEWAAAERMLAQFYEARNETSELFDQLGFDKLELEGRTYFGGFEGGHYTGKGLDTAIDIVEAELPNPSDYDRGIEPTNVEVDIALAIFGKFPTPGVGSAAGMAGRAVAGAFRFVVPRAIREIGVRVLKYAVSTTGQFALKSVPQVTRFLLRRMQTAGGRGLAWMEAKVRAAGGRMFAKTTETGTALRPAGWGATSRFGDVVYSTLGSADEVALVRIHESVHSFLSPKFRLFRGLRASVMEKGYKWSAILKYIEEALAESYAQLRVHGIRGLPTGIKFPISEGYVTIQQLAAEGAVGTIVVGGVVYYVFYDSE